jgi:hypothetical protein
VVEKSGALGAGANGAKYGMFYCPEGAEEFSPGFQPWERQIRRFALKGREITMRMKCAVNAFDLEPFQGSSPDR